MKDLIKENETLQPMLNDKDNSLLESVGVETLNPPYKKSGSGCQQFF